MHAPLVALLLAGACLAACPAVARAEPVVGASSAAGSVAADSAGTWSVRLLPAAVVDGEVVRLADIARIEGDPALGAVVVSWSPPPGTERVIPRSIAAQALAGRFARPIEVGGVDAARVRRVGRGTAAIDAEGLTRRAGAELIARRPDLAGETVAFRVDLDPARIPAGPASTEILLSNLQGDRVAGRMLVDYDRGYRRIVPFALEGETVRSEWRAARFIRSGAVVVPEDVRRLEVRAGLALRRAPYHDSPVGLVARKNVREGAPLSQDLFGRMITVKKGDKVVVRSDNELICVEIQGVALEEGDVGDTIAVRNLKSGRSIRAVVRGPGEAAIARGR